MNHIFQLNEVKIIQRAQEERDQNQPLFSYGREKMGQMNEHSGWAISQLHGKEIGKPGPVSL